MPRRRTSGERVLGPYRRADGRFAVVLKMSGGESPTEKWHLFHSEREALRAKHAMEAGLEVVPEETSLADAIEQYIRFLGDGGRQPSTQQEAGFRLRPLVAVAGGPAVPLDEVTRGHVETRLAAVPSVAGKKGTLGRIRAFFRWAVERRVAFHNVTEGITIVGRVNHGKTTHTRTEARVLDATLQNAATGTDPIRAATATALLVELYAGLREGEVLRLQVRDLDFGSNPPVLSVARRTKTEAGIRDIEIPPELADLLRPYVKGKGMTDWLWPAPHTDEGHRAKGWLKKWVRVYCREAGVTVTCQHGLRATHGRLSREAGVTAHVIAQQLGHTNDKVTVESYIGTAVEDRQNNRRALKVLRGGTAAHA